MPLTPPQVARLIQARGPRLYHLTDAENLVAILVQGLVPGKASQFEQHLLRTGCLYFCDLRTARSNLLGHFDAGWGDAVVSVEITALNPVSFRADEDYYRGEARSRGYDTAATSILARFPGVDEPKAIAAAYLDGGTIAYAGAVRPALLRLELVPPRPDLPAIEPYRARLRSAEHYHSGLTEPSFLRDLAHAWKASLSEF